MEKNYDELPKLNITGEVTTQGKWVWFKLKYEFELF